MNTDKCENSLPSSETFDLHARAEVQEKAQREVSGGEVIQTLGGVSIVEIPHCLGFYKHPTFHDNVGEILSHYHSVVNHINFKLLSELEARLCQLVHQGILIHLFREPASEDVVNAERTANDSLR